MGKSNEVKAKKGKKDKEEVLAVSDSEKISKKEKKRKLAESEEDPPVDKKEKKKKKKDKAAADEVEEPQTESKKKKKEKKCDDTEEPKSEKKKKKKAKTESAEEETPSKKAAKEDSDEEEEETMVIKNKDTKAAAAVAACTSAKCWVGNLSFKIDEEQLKEALAKCGEIKNIQWQEDRETGKFRGSGIVEFESTEAAGKCVQMEGEEVLGRPLRTRAWEERGGSKPAREPRPISAKPDNCTTLFAGNLSYDIDDDKMAEFFKDCGEIKQIRWLTDKESGDFRGCGFVEFYDGDAVDKGIKKNGENLLSRSIRLDYSAPRPPRQ
mmetsp:Transcript_28562/g.53915  ORF Transcript_28562/g.53915 Transcript_28562/m.53915 type:complete len:323 (+) Transcript_28562:131-1099(+)|eukprot:CAMPEP_0114304478 /NCGR_PEP_ID=MMETSP0059-20121206/15812_1 /TAXON_ID=36894 /ORGANISM="Pyramimonas parkeae, Strain CCMP726" /LENGTH=322 /DNA_ID=CAMNT_0001427587 /DNA_START=118 /DNA_END=1086 /DNA_ORIENTATION=-